MEVEMRIVGGKVLIDIDKAKLVMQFNPNVNDPISCQDVIDNNALALQVLTRWLCGNDKSNELDALSIWVGENSCQVYPIEECTSTTLVFTDINVVGDADPANTLWFIFEKEEWKTLDKLYGIDLSSKLEKIWGICEDRMKFINHLVTTPYDRYNSKSQLDELSDSNVLDTSISIELPNEI